MGEDHMTLLRPNPINATRFLWHPKDRMYSVEMSDIGGFGRAFDDSCDEGITLVERNGLREVVCVVDEEVRDAENDVQYWVLKPWRYKGTPFTIVVFND
jgi:hypothetical protein